MNWFLTAHEQIETYFDSSRPLIEEERQRRLVACIDGFHHLFTHLAGELRIREDWPTPHCVISPFHTGIIEHSKVAGVDFTLGVSLYGWFIEAPLADSRQIRHMKDEYWRHIARLSTLGKAELHEYSDQSIPEGFPNVQILRQHRGSLVFSIAREYILEVLTERDEDYVHSFGNIYVTLPLESEEVAVENFFRAALESLYRSNQMLKRSLYQKRKREINGSEKEQIAN